MFCSECGKETTDGAKFCRYCGFELAPSEKAGDKPQSTEGFAGELRAAIESDVMPAQNDYQSAPFASEPVYTPAPNAYASNPSYTGVSANAAFPAYPAANSYAQPPQYVYASPYATKASGSKKTWMIILIVVAALCMLGLAAANIFFAKEIRNYVAHNYSLPDFGIFDHDYSSGDFGGFVTSGGSLEDAWDGISGYWEAQDGSYLYIINDGGCYISMVGANSLEMYTGEVKDYRATGADTFTVAFDYIDNFSSSSGIKSATLFFDAHESANGELLSSTSDSDSYTPYTRVA